MSGGNAFDPNKYTSVQSYDFWQRSSDQRVSCLTIIGFLRLGSGLLSTILWGMALCSMSLSQYDTISVRKYVNMTFISMSLRHYKT